MFLIATFLMVIIAIGIKFTLEVVKMDIVW
jgi:hypothetical protein